jgi:hypothetical protein
VVHYRGYVRSAAQRRTMWVEPDQLYRMGHGRLWRRDLAEREGKRHTLARVSSSGLGFGGKHQADEVRKATGS